MRADLDTLVIALYCAACALFPSERTPRRGRPEKISDNELLCLMVAQMLLQCPSDRTFLRRAGRRLGHLFPYLPGQSRYNERCRLLAPKLGAALEGARGRDAGRQRQSAAARHDSASLRPVVQTTRTSQLAPWAGFGYCPAHSRRYWGFKLVLFCAPDGTIVDFDLVAANTSERQAALALLEANSIEGTTIICDKGFAGADFEAAVHEMHRAGSNATAAAPPQASSPESPRGSSPSAPASTSTNDSASTAASSPHTPIKRSTI